MKENTITIKSLNDLFHYDMSTFSIAEIKLSHILPIWARKVGSIKLKTVLCKYENLINQNVEKMEPFLFEESINSLALTHTIMDAFIEQTNEKLSFCTDTEIKDACLLACIQNINHFKISIYGTAASFANTLGLKDQSSFFYEAEESEKNIDTLLSQIAEQEINYRARTPFAISK